MNRLKLRVDLKNYLSSIGVTPYQLGKWAPDVSAPMVYAICAGTRRPSFDVLEALLNALRAQGFDAQLSDILKTDEE